MQLQQYWHLYCFAILGSTSAVIHSVNQRLLRNWPGSGSRDLSRLLARKITKGVHSHVQTSLAELPNSTHTCRGVWAAWKARYRKRGWEALCRLMMAVAGAWCSDRWRPGPPGRCRGSRIRPCDRHGRSLEKVTAICVCVCVCVCVSVCVCVCT